MATSAAEPHGNGRSAALPRVHADWLQPSLGVGGVRAVMTTRHGGGSAPPLDSMNVGTSVNDDPAVVAANRRLLADAIGARPVYLWQVHGSRVVRLRSSDPVDAPLEKADASITTEAGIGCAVQAADCMPVLFAVADAKGRGVAVGAAHAGWRGLASGVLGETVKALCEVSGCEPSAISAWMGPCIGPDRFEVGADVLQAFDVDPAGRSTLHFKPHALKSNAPGKWMADLPGLARDRLAAAGVTRISGGEHCTVSNASRFFSYRRDRLTGRMVAVVWLE
ncbi:MAG: hypothetical protein JWP52_3801 [Rhizobacter sp.]|nr:hypothetical protein [Rhizobacter sp.]